MSNETLENGPKYLSSKIFSKIDFPPSTTQENLGNPLNDFSLLV